MAPTIPVVVRPGNPKLLDRVRDGIRRKHYSFRTEQTYIDWIRRFILFHRKRHPSEMAEAEVTEFLTSLAREGNVAASTQNQALSALLFLYKEVLKQEIVWLGRKLSNTRFSAASLRQESNEVRHTMKDKESGNNIAIISNAPPKNEAKYQNANDNYYADRVERLHDSNFSSVGARRHPAEQPWLIRVSAANGGKQTKSVRRNRADEIKLTGWRPEPRPSARCVQVQTLSEHFS